VPGHAFTILVARLSVTASREEVDGHVSEAGAGGVRVVDDRHG